MRLPELNLFKHQLEGIARIKESKRCLLAWEPGCAKTRTTLEALRALACERVLVVAPAALLSVWHDEMMKWYGTTPTLVRGTKAKRESLWQATGIKVVSYETLRADFPIVRGLSWDAIVLDESYKIQNPRSKITKTILSLSAPVRVALNGVPLSNSWADLWAVCTWLDPGCLYGSFWKFRSIHAIMNPYYPAIVGWRDVEGIKRRTEHLISWKRKEDVLKDLPPISEQVISFDLSKKEREVYDLIRDELRVELQGEDVPVGNALVKLLRLKQTTNGLFAFGENKVSSKLDLCLELLSSLPAGASALVFSSFKETINELHKRLPDALKITGDTGAVEREETVKLFQSGAVLTLIGTDSVAFGLNLQAASYVLNLDLPYSYAKYQQRISRAHRQGQTRPVTVWNLQANKSVDFHVAKILSRKMVMADDAAGITREDIDEILNT